MKTRIPIFCMIILSLVVFIPQASACSCAADRTIEDSFLEADNVIFSGTVTGIKELQRTYLVTFEIEQSWKGIPIDVTSINTMTSQSSSMCGYNFTANQSYLVEAYGKWDQTPEVGICGSTTLLDFAHEQISFLNKNTQNDDKEFASKPTIIELSDLEYDDIIEYGIYTDNMEMPGILLARTQYYVILKVEFEQKDLPNDNTQVIGTVGYAFQEGDKMLHPPMNENVTQEEAMVFMKRLQQYNIEFRQASTISNSYEFIVDVKKPFYVKFPIQIEQSGLYTYQFFERTDILEGPSSNAMGPLVIVEKYSKALDEEGKCKNEKFSRIIKHDYSSMACVYPSTVSKLQDSGWAIDNRIPEEFSDSNQVNKIFVP